MKPWQVIFLCLLASALVFVSKCFSSSSSSSLMFLPERRPMRELSVSSFNQQDQYHKIQDVIREKRRRNTQGKGGSMGTGISRRVEQEDSEDEPLNYHIDYHGVTTHPTPTPKHPEP